MTWVILTLLSQVATAIETLSEKVLMVGNGKTVSPLVAAFYRNAGFYFFVLIASVFGIFGSASFFMTPLIFLAGALHIFSSLGYDYFLRNAEITRVSALGFTFPFFFLAFDAILFNNTFTLPQYVGIILLVMGGVLFSIKLQQRTLSAALSPTVWKFLLIRFAVTGLQYAVFKYYNTTQGLNEVSFYLSTWMVVLAVFLGVIAYKGELKETYQTLGHKQFMTTTMLAKFFDFFSGIFFLQAIALSGVTQVNALNATSPLVFLAVSYIISLFGFDLQENFSKAQVLQKTGASVLLVIGAMLLIF